MTEAPVVAPLLARRWRRWALGSLGALLLLIAAIWLILPRWVQGSGARLASQALGREVTIGDAAFMPWRLAVAIKDLRIGGTSGSAEPLLTVGRVEAAVSLRSGWHWRPILESLTIERPVLRVTRLAPGRYDVDDLIARFSKPTTQPETKSTALALYNIKLIDGQMLLDDRPAAQQHALSALQLSLPFLSTLDADVTVRVQPALSGTLNGVAFGSTAEALPFADRREAVLKFKLDGLDLAPYVAYAPEALPLKLKQGLVDADLALRFAQAPKGAQKQVPSLSLSGDVALRNFALQTPDGEPWLGWQALRVNLKDVQPLLRQVKLGAVGWTGLSLAIARDATGRVWLPTVAATPGEAPSPWNFALDSFALAEATLDWRDAALRPSATLRVEAISANLGATTWPLTAAVPLRYGLQLKGKGAPFSLNGEGSLSADQLALNWRWADLSLADFAPYVQAVLPAQVRGVLAGAGDAKLSLPLAPDALGRTQLTLSALRLKNFSLAVNGAGKAGPLMSLSALNLDSLNLDTASRQLNLGELKLVQPAVSLSRDAAGAWSYQALLPAPAPPLPPPSQAAAPATSAPDTLTPRWSVALQGLEVDRGSAALRDAAAAGGAALSATQIKLRMRQLAWPLGAAASPIELALNLGGQPGGPQAKGTSAATSAATSAGSVQWTGRLALAPLAASGRLTVKRLPLHLFDPYLDPSWSLHLEQALLGLKGEFSAQMQAAGLQARLNGDLRVADFRLQQARQIDGERVIGDDLLIWQSLNLTGLTLALTPGAATQVDIAEAGLSDFFARLIINEQGRFILRDLGPQEVAAAAVAASDTPAKLPLMLSIGTTRLAKGNVDFSDRFIRPNYSAELSELQGNLGAFSTDRPDMAPLTVRGRVAGTGQLEIDGLLNPAGGALAMDIKAAATDIELAPLSPYAGKYAGYAIERGKFSTRLHYRIEPGGALQASNQIILNQLTFGDKVDSPDATSLPVLFAAALLKDRNGVIDVNLPVSGSIKDPDFSIGGLVIKLIVNLLTKALTAPFSLFSGGEAGDLSQAVFAPGSAQVSTPAQLDQVAKMLDERPGLSLTITGHADAAVEKAAMQAAMLDAAVLRLSGNVSVGLKRLYDSSKLPNKPRNVLGFAKDLPAAEMRTLLLASFAVTDDAARELALRRSVAVRDALMARGVPNSRIFLAAPKTQQAQNTQDPGAPRAEMALKAR